MPQTIRAVVVDPAAPGKLAVKAVGCATPTARSRVPSAIS
jgi:hypothetical protein